MSMPMDDTAERARFKMDLLKRWNEADAALKRAKATEAELRITLIQTFFAPEGQNEPYVMPDGTHNIDLGGDWKLKAVGKTNYTVNNKEDAAILAQEAIEREVENGKILAERIFTWEANLKLGEYKQLPPAAKAIVDKILTSKPGMPSLELIPPKALQK